MEEGEKAECEKQRGGKESGNWNVRGSGISSKRRGRVESGGHANTEDEKRGKRESAIKYERN